ncbi:hypothetical protein MMC18_002061 [Xylographa bjoerkii]|nr:hypothetical protein [Xylographa bjoerkii]
MSASCAHPLLRFQSEKKLREAVRSTIAGMPGASMTAPQESFKVRSEGTQPTRQSTQYPSDVPAISSTKRDLINSAESTTHTIFGHIHCSSRTYVMLRQSSRQSTKDTKPSMRQQIFETSFWLKPSDWLIKCGVAYAVNLQVAKSSEAGWKASLKTFNVRFP